MSRGWRALLGGLAGTLVLALAAGWLVTRVEAPTAAGGPGAAAPGARPQAPAARQASPSALAPSAAAPTAGTPPSSGAAATLPPAQAPATGSAGGQGAQPAPAPDGDRSSVASSARGDAGAMHKLDQAGIQSAIQEKIPEIKECYQSWLGMNPHLSGKLLVGFRIVPDDGGTEGVVGEIAIADGGLGHVAMEGCVMNVMSAMRFEAPKGELTVNYPLRFRSEPEKQ